MKPKWNIIIMISIIFQLKIKYCNQKKSSWNKKRKFLFSNYLLLLMLILIQVHSNIKLLNLKKLIIYCNKTFNKYKITKLLIFPKIQPSIILVKFLMSMILMIITKMIIIIQSIIKFISMNMNYNKNQPNCKNQKKK